MNATSPYRPVVAVMSCWKYRDAWKPFFHLFRKFWPDCPYDVYLITDQAGDVLSSDHAPGLAHTHVGVPGITWGDLLSGFCAEHHDSPILFMQEDFFLTLPVDNGGIYLGLDALRVKNAGCVRLYPCPGADEPIGNLSFGNVSLSAPYRISCQAAWWQPSFLGHLAKKFQDAWAIEQLGTPYTRRVASPPILSWHREITPWPMEYICTGIVRGLWTPAALELFKTHGIEIDRSTNRQVMREGE